MATNGKEVRTVFFKGQYPWKHPRDAALRIERPEARPVREIAYRTNTAWAAVAIIDLLRTLQACTTAQLAYKLGLDIQAVRRRVKVLRAAGVVSAVKNPDRSVTISLIR